MLGTGEFNAGGTLGWPSIPSSEKIGIFLVALCYSDNLHSDISTLSTSLVLGVGVTSIYGGDLLIARYQIGKCSVCLTVAHNTNISMAKLVNAGMVSSCTSHHFTPYGRYELNKSASLPMCGFIAQLVEHRTGIAEVMGSNSVEALIVSGFFFPIA